MIGRGYNVIYVKIRYLINQTFLIDKPKCKNTLLNDKI